jgi:hypothetical protein
MKFFHWPVAARTAGEPGRLERQRKAECNRFFLSNVSSPSDGFAAFGALRAPACSAGCGKKKCKAGAFIFPYRKGGGKQRTATSPYLAQNHFWKNPIVEAAEITKFSPS